VVLAILVLGELNAVAIEMVDCAELVVVGANDRHVLRDFACIHGNAPAVTHGSPWRISSISPNDAGAYAPHAVDTSGITCLGLVCSV
jgi:hypothetical protein